MTAYSTTLSPASRLSPERQKVATRGAMVYWSMSRRRQSAEWPARPRLWLVDAFVHGHFKGNPAAVCLLPAPKSARWMQRIAARMRLSETAFVHPSANGFGLRWFTPKAEVALCGHATLASAHALWDAGLLGRGENARFHTRSGVLTARRRDSLIVMDFPSHDPRPTKAPRALLSALRARPVYVATIRRQYFIVLESESALRRLAPPMASLESIPADGFIVTSRSTRRPYDFVSRYFAPAEGIPEDPVTGSAHCVLGPYWSRKLGKKSLVGLQASPRGGVVRVRIGRNRVFIGGQARTRRSRLPMPPRRVGRSPRLFRNDRRRRPSPT